MDDELRDAERQPRGRRGVAPASGIAVRRTVEQALEDAAADPARVRGRQVGERRERSDGGDPDVRGAPGDPEREVAARRVPDDGDAVEIDGEPGQGVDAGDDVVERPGPAGAARTEPPVLEVPDGEARRHEVEGDRVELIAAVRHLPEAAVEQADDRRARRVRKVEVALLGGVVAETESLHAGGAHG